MSKIYDWDEMANLFRFPSAATDLVDEPLSEPFMEGITLEYAARHIVDDTTNEWRYAVTRDGPPYSDQIDVKTLAGAMIARDALNRQPL
jgi:hypothetical protein